MRVISPVVAALLLSTSHGFPWSPFLSTLYTKHPLPFTARIVRNAAASSKSSFESSYDTNLSEECNANAPSSTCASAILSYLDALSAGTVRPISAPSGIIASYFDALSPNGPPSNAAVSSYLDILSSGAIPPPTLEAVAAYLDAILDEVITTPSSAADIVASMKKEGDAAPPTSLSESVEESTNLKSLEERLATTQKALKHALSGIEATQGSVSLAKASKHNSSAKLQEIWDDTTSSVTVQGGSLRTWSYTSPVVERVQIILKTDGRPLDADLSLWQGPDNTPVKMRIYLEDGSMRPFSAVIETPRGPNTVSVRNVGQIEFPLDAVVSANSVDANYADFAGSNSGRVPTTIQGGALRTYPFNPSVDTVKILLTTDGRPLCARVELLQGPNTNKQVVELYTEDGMDRPFFAEVASPGSGNVVRIVNTAPVEFPLTASVEPGQMNADFSAMDPIIGGNVL